MLLTIEDGPVATDRSLRSAPLRTDIQGLRAIAVSMVMAYHLWPHGLPGGFAGVDVFFVISGFLITAHLLARSLRTPRDLAAFWSRRICRLLPAAFLVLATTLAATRLLAPDTAWANTAAQARAAAFYVVNWRLARDSVDYLAAQNAPTPVQHYWSLSVEEQFYLVWPVLLLVLVAIGSWIGRMERRRLPVVIAGLAVVVAVSFGYSMGETAADPARAYFVTPTRIWELGVGGLLAALFSRRARGVDRPAEAVRLPATARAVLAWAGLAAIAWTAITFSGTTAFPGWRAALPVLGTAALIAAGASAVPRSPGPLLAQRPVQWLGDASYSAYLWHWPLIVLAPSVLDRRLDTVDRLAIIGLTLVLAGLTKRFVEDRFRNPAGGRGWWRPFVLAGVGMALVAGSATAETHEVSHREAVAKVAAHRALAAPHACVGAAALAAPSGVCPATTRGPVYPAPVAAAQDKSDAYGDVSGTKDCFAARPAFHVTTCSRGNPAASVRVALVGNSHAGQWLPALEQAASQHDWHITTYLSSQCALASTPQQFDTHAISFACRTWVRQVTQQIVHGGYDLVVMANRIAMPSPGHSLTSSFGPYEAGYARVLRSFRAAHLRVLGIRDTPAPSTEQVPDCLASHPNDYRPCSGTRAAWLPREPLTDAIAALHDPRITEADLTDFICQQQLCPAAAGEVVVYFDNSHLTASYAKTLTPYLMPALEGALHS